MRNWDDETSTSNKSPASAKSASNPYINTQETSPNAETMASTSTSTSANPPTLADLDLTNPAYREKNSNLTASTDSRPVSAAPFNEAETKKLLRKLDLHLIPFLALIYLYVGRPPLSLFSSLLPPSPHYPCA